MRVVTVDIATQLLEGILKLPRGTRIVGVTQSVEQHLHGVFSMLITSDNLPEVHTGLVIPWGRITARTEFCTQDEVTHLIKCEVEVA